MNIGPGWDLSPRSKRRRHSQPTPKQRKITPSNRALCLVGTMRRKTGSKPLRSETLATESQHREIRGRFVPLHSARKTIPLPRPLGLVVFGADGVARVVAIPSHHGALHDAVEAGRTDPSKAHRGKLRRVSAKSICNGQRKRSSLWASGEPGPNLCEASDYPKVRGQRFVQYKPIQPSP